MLYDVVIYIVDMPNDDLFFFFAPSISFDVLLSCPGLRQPKGPGETKKVNDNKTSSNFLMVTIGRTASGVLNLIVSLKFRLKVTSFGFQHRSPSKLPQTTALFQAPHLHIQFDFRLPCGLSSSRF